MDLTVTPGSAVTTVDDLEAVLGERPPVTLAKSIPFLDDHCRTFLARSPFAVLGAHDTAGIQRSLVVGGAPGVLVAADRTTLRVDPHALPDGLGDGGPAGLVALVPGYGETLRVNGRLHRDGGATVLRVEEAFLHCARCVSRSKLWDTAAVGSDTSGSEASDSAVTDTDLDHPAVRAFLDRSPFLTLTSTDPSGGTDVSPKGDVPGFAVPLGPRTLALPDRPGNRRTDTLRNLLQHPAIAVAALVPGDDRVLHVEGRARVTTDPGLRARLAAGLAEPALGVVVDVDRVDLRPDPGLREARLWHPDGHAEASELPRAGEIWTDHVALDNVG